MRHWVPVIIMDGLWPWVWETRDLAAYLTDLAASAYQAGGWYVAFSIDDIRAWSADRQRDYEAARKRHCIAHGIPDHAGRGSSRGKV